MQKTKNLIFDYGKVLVDYDFEAYFRRLIPDEQRCKEFAAIMCHEDVMRLLDREERPYEENMESIIRQHPQFEQETRSFAQDFSSIVTGEVQGMNELLCQLKHEGYRLYGLTNWCSKVHETIAQYPIFRLLDGMVISSEEHLVKPEPAIYQRLMDKYQLRPEDCIFTDDRPENVEAARRLGMHGIVFRNAKQYEEELEIMLNAL